MTSSEHRNGATFRASHKSVQMVHDSCTYHLSISLSPPALSDRSGYVVGPYSTIDLHVTRLADMHAFVRVIKHLAISFKVSLIDCIRSRIEPSSADCPPQSVHQWLRRRFHPVLELLTQSTPHLRHSINHDRLIKAIIHFLAACKAYPGAHILLEVFVEEAGLASGLS